MTLPNGASIESTHTAQLQLQGFSSNALKANVFKEIQKSLFSIGKFCDDNKIAIFHKNKCFILNDILNMPELKRIIHANTIKTGHREHNTGLWLLKTNNNPTTQLNSVCHLSKIKEIIEYHHHSLFIPVKSTWIKAIKNGNLQSLPSLHLKQVEKYMPLSPPTSKGHIRQVKQNISTKLQSTSTITKSEDTKNNLVFVKHYNMTKLICSDQTGRFPVTSDRGNKYMMVVLDNDSNAILSEPLPSRSQNHLIHAFSKIHDRLVTAGRKPIFVRLDNEISNSMKKYMNDEKLKFQLVPPNNHCRNYAEKAIGTWKDHFIAGLASLDQNFPLKLWCRLTQHADITLTCYEIQESIHIYLHMKIYLARLTTIKHH